MKKLARYLLIYGCMVAEGGFYFSLSNIKGLFKNVQKFTLLNTNL